MKEKMDLLVKENEELKALLSKTDLSDYEFIDDSSNDQLLYVSYFTICLFHKHKNTFVVEYRHNGQLHIQLDTMQEEAVTKLLVPLDQEPKVTLMKDSSKEQMLFQIAEESNMRAVKNVQAVQAVQAVQVEVGELICSVPLAFDLQTDYMSLLPCL